MCIRLHKCAWSHWGCSSDSVIRKSCRKAIKGCRSYVVSCVIMGKAAPALRHVSQKLRHWRKTLHTCDSFFPGLTQVCSILRQWRNFCDTCRKAGAALPIMRQGWRTSLHSCDSFASKIANDASKWTASKTLQTYVLPPNYHHLKMEMN